MTNMILCGCGGRMGEAVSKLLGNRTDIKIVAGVDIDASSVAAASGYPVYQSVVEFPGKADVIVDFSHHSALPSLIEYAKKTATPIVVCTTGHTQEEIALMKSAAKEIGVFFSGNMSIGINLVIELCKRAANALGDSFDIEIIEKHHNKKLDAPSGTALMIANAISDELDNNRCTPEHTNTKYVYDRHSERRQRTKDEIGIHSVRGGTIVGEHEVIFAGNNEVVTISHSATSREVFAEGAVRAALFMHKKTEGFYNMSDVIHERLIAVLSDLGLN